jgi:putative flippase GtrA
LSDSRNAPALTACEPEAGPTPQLRAGAGSLFVGRLVEFVRRLVERQGVRFVLVGVVNSGFSFGVFAALQLTLGKLVHYLVVLVLSNLLGILEAYVLQRWLVFQVTGRWWRDLAKFGSVYLVAFVVNAVALPLLVEVVGVPVLAAQAAVMLATAVGTFAIHRVYTFRRPEGSDTQAR